MTFKAQVECLPVPPVETIQSHKTPQGKQGILEIPKQAATIIRNFIDYNLMTYLNLTTPVPASNVPPELQNSIVGNFLLGNFIPPPVEYYPETPAQPTEANPIFSTNEESYNVQVQPTVVASPPPPPPPSMSPNIPEVLASIGTAPPETKPNVIPSNAPVSTLALEQGTSMNGIYNPNPLALLLTNNPDNEVYWIPDVTRPSLIIPIVTSTTPQPSPTTDADDQPKSTTEEDEEGEGDEEEVLIIRRKKL